MTGDQPHYGTPFMQRILGVFPEPTVRLAPTLQVRELTSLPEEILRYYNDLFDRTAPRYREPLIYAEPKPKRKVW